MVESGNESAIFGAWGLRTKSWGLYLRPRRGRIQRVIRSTYEVGFCFSRISLNFYFFVLHWQCVHNPCISLTEDITLSSSPNRLS